jgi:hypothetical protein
VADSTESSIVIDAEPDAISAVIADFEAYPQWATMVKSCTPIEHYDDGTVKQVKFVIDAGIVKDEYVNEYVWDGSGGCSWHLVSGKMLKAQQGRYELIPGKTDGGPRTTVQYELSVELAVPMLGMLKRKAEKMIMDTALKELKKRVESE